MLRVCEALLTDPRGRQEDMQEDMRGRRSPGARRDEKNGGRSPRIRTLATGCGASFLDLVQFDAAILEAAFFGVVAGDRLRFAISLGDQAIGRDALADQIAANRVGTAQ